VGAGVLFILLLAAYLCWLEAGPRVFPGVTVGPVPAGGMTPARLEAELTRRLVRLGGEAGGPYAGVDVVFRDPGTGREWPADAGDLGLRLDLGTTVDRAMAAGRSGGPLVRMASLAVVSARGLEIAPTLSVDRQAAESFLDGVAALVDVIPRNVSLDHETGLVREGRAGRLLDPEGTIDALLQAAGELPEAGPLRVEVVVRTVPAAGDPGRLEALARERLACSSTSLAGSAPGRTWNIALAAAAIDGLVLPPGGRLSFNDVVGPRTAARGFRPALEIVAGALVSGIGGGVCQVATTLFNAALLADLDVVVRHHHPRPVPYIGLGRDATVSYPALDLVVENPRAFSVVVTTSVRGADLEIAVWGRRAAASEVQLVVEELNRVRAGSRQMFDPSLPPGAREEVEAPFDGRDVRLWRVVRQFGQVVRRELLFVDHYEPVEGLVKVGPSGLAETWARGWTGR